MSAGPGARPLIGITGYEALASWGPWRERAALLPMTYLRKVEAAGGVPVVLPPLGDPAAVAERIDGLVLAGGPDVDPARYGADRHAETQPADEARDAYETAVVTAAWQRRLPVLAICRGLQLANVARGGTLIQHLPEVVGSPAHSPGGDCYGETVVRVAEGSTLAAALGDSLVHAPCHHHQAVERLGEGLLAVAWAEDGTLEAFEDPSRPEFLAVQWHPEEEEGDALFDWLIERARSRSSASLPAP